MITTFKTKAELCGEEVELHIEADGYVYRENYGADADGHHKKMRTEAEVHSIIVLDGNGKDRSMEIESSDVLSNRIYEESLDHLIEQYNEGDDHAGVHPNTANAIAMLEAQLSEAREVIEWYGNRDNWSSTGMGLAIHWINQVVDDADQTPHEPEEMGKTKWHGGKKAREWLKKWGC